MGMAMLVSSVHSPTRVAEVADGELGHHLVGEARSELVLRADRIAGRRGEDPRRRRVRLDGAEDVYRAHSSRSSGELPFLDECVGELVLSLGYDIGSPGFVAEHLRRQGKYSRAR